MIARIRAMKTCLYAPSLECFDPAQITIKNDRTLIKSKGHTS